MLRTDGMVTFLSLPSGAGHIHGLTRAYGPAYTRRMCELTYHELLQGKPVQLGAFVFLDRERMNPYQRNLAIQIWNRLAAHGSKVRLYNDPARQLGRAELLTRLHEKGINDYRAYSLTDVGPHVRFPVFVRLDSDHMGPRTGILDSMAELEREIDRLVLQGLDPDDLIVIEFLNVANAEGLYRRYGALRIGPMISCNHVYLSENWIGKSDTAIMNEVTREESENYYLSNPQVDMLMPIFDLAGIQYGRIDYALVDGRPQIWEINDNPQYGPGQSSPFHRLKRHQRWAEGFAALDEGLEDGQPITIPARDLDLHRMLEPC